ncbi:MAG: DUF2721 domain-containing protein [Cytophagales bacterium]|nr:MAG: DUF2721 domain-containing protein [Cytophagales bacterium]
MELTLNTPAILFPTISLLLLAYTNRFISIGNRLRNLHERYSSFQTKEILQQISIFKRRIKMIRNLQLSGIASLFFCVLTMLLIFENFTAAAKWVFTFSLILLLTAFSIAAYEIIISTQAMNIQLKDIEEELDK